LKAAPTVVATPSQMTEVLSAHAAVGRMFTGGGIFVFRKPTCLVGGAGGAGWLRRPLSCPWPNL
jgi:hypothetical protein